MAGEPRIKVAIHGYYGFHNVGDEAILAVIIEGLRREIPHVDLTVISGDPRWTKRVHGVGAVDSQDLAKVAACVRESSLVISGGGGLFHDYWPRDNAEVLAFPAAGGPSYAHVPVLAKLYGKPLALLAHGVGPITTDEGANLVRFVVGLADRVTLRDEGSLKCLKALGCATTVLAVSPDPAFAFPMPPREEARRRVAQAIGRPGGHEQPVVGVCIRPWEEGSPDWAERVAEALDIFLAETDALALFVPFHEFGSMSDQAQAKAIMARMTRSDRCFALDGRPPADVAALLAGCDAVLAMRLHSAIFGITGAVPVLALAYDPKVSETMRQVGLEDHTVPLEALDARHLAARLKELLDRAPACSAALKEITESQAGLVRVHFDGLAQLAKTAQRRPSGLEPAQPPPPADHHRAWRATERRLEEVRNTLAEEVEDLRSRQARMEDELEDTNRRFREYYHDKELYIAALRAELRRARALGLAGMVGLLPLIKRLSAPLARLLEGMSRGVARRLAPGWLPFLYKELSRPAVSGERRGEVTVYFTNEEPFPNYPHQVQLKKKRGGRRERVSLIAMERNEEASAGQWVRSLLKQSRLPDEVIIVDNGSTDGTMAILEEFAREAPLPVKLLVAADANIAEGRNKAIAQARHPVLAVTDFGNELDRHWLERLVAPFEINPEVQVAAGWYEPRARSLLGRAMAMELRPSLSEVDPASFLPASCSVAFRREAWKSVNGYPEWLTLTGEDTFFAHELKEYCRDWAFVPDAKVYWHAPDSLLGSLTKMYRWSLGDGESGLFADRYWGMLKATVRDALLVGAMALFLMLSLFLGWWLLLVPATAATGWAAYFALRLATAGNAAMRAKRRAPVATMALWALTFPLMRAARVLGYVRGVANRPKAVARRATGAEGVTFILSGVPITDSGGGQRAGQLAMALLRMNRMVVFINMFPSYESVNLNVTIGHPLLFLYSLRTFDLKAFLRRYPLVAEMPKTVIVEFPLAEFADLAAQLRRAGAKVVFDCIDDWATSLGGSWYSLETERRLIASSDVLVATAPLLRQRLEEISGRPVALVPNAVNTDLFRRDATYPRPLDLAAGDFIICYIGALWGEWFDWRLLLKVALAYPQASVVVIGDYRGQCPDHPRNLHFLGLKPQADLPAYLAHVDVAIIPWTVSRLTHATNPLKVYEYLAMGKPVVAPRIQALDGIPYVLLAESEEEFIANIDRARTMELDDAVIDSFIADNSWAQRVSTLTRLWADSGSGPPRG